MVVAYWLAAVFAFVFCGFFAYVALWLHVYPSSVISMRSLPAPVFFLLSVALPISLVFRTWVPPHGIFQSFSCHHHFSGLAGSG